MKAIMTLIDHPSGRKKRRPLLTVSFRCIGVEYRRDDDDCFVFRDTPSHQEGDAQALNDINMHIDQVAKKRRASFRLVEKS